MNSKTALITGANRGIGREVAAQLAGMGATVVMVSRDEGRGRTAQAEIQNAVGHDRVHLIIGDLASLDDIRRIAQEYKDRFGQLDVLINNAAIVPSERKESTDGYELQFAVNHLAPFLLTHLLLDRLVMAAPSRIIVVASRAHERGKINFDDIQSEHAYGRWPAYNQSKLANVMFCYELARRLEGSGVTVNSLHPGVIFTRLLQDLVALPTWLNKLFEWVTGSVKDGAKTIVYLATSDEVQSVSGKYFVDCKPKLSGRRAYDQKAQRQLWQLSEQLTGMAHRVDSGRPGR